MANIINIGTSAMMAYQSALNVASQNIANADTPFYSRRSVDLAENPNMTGVTIKDVRRIYDETANRYVQTTNSTHSQWDLYLQQISNFEPLFDSDTTSIGVKISDSLNALVQIENNFNPSNRSLYLSKLTDLSTQFQTANAEINTQLRNINSSLQTEVDQINNILSALNGINQQMLASINVDDPQLLDQREALVQELSTYMDFNASYDQLGLLNLSLNNGLTILSINPPVQFVTTTDPANPQNLGIGVNNGVATMDITSLIHGGQIAGWLNYRSDVQQAQNELGRLALAFADNLNRQNALGVDGNGNLGSDIFTDINSSGMINSRVLSNSNNTGVSNMTVTIDDTSALTTSDYKLSIGAGNTYRLTRTSDNAVLSTGSLSTLPTTISADGFTIDVNSGTFNTGDSYIISPTRGALTNMTVAMSDPSQLALGWPVAVRPGVSQPGSNGSIKVTSITDTTNSSFTTTPKALTPPIEVVFSVTAGVTQYTLYDSTTSTAIEGPINYTSGADIFPTPGGYDPGYTVTISGNNIQDGDTFYIEYNTNTSGDNSNARAMADLYNQPTILGANGQMVNFNEAYQLLSSNISVKVNNAVSREQTSANLLSQAEQRRDSISGVDLTEETMDLQHYQLAYQASAQILQVAKSIIDIISQI